MLIRGDVFIVQELKRIADATEAIAESLRASKGADSLVRPDDIATEYRNQSAVISQILFASPGDTIHFHGGIEDVEVEQLVRTIANASASAERVATYFRELIKPAHVKHEVNIAAAQRYAVTLRDSLKMLSRIMGGGNYVQKTPEWTKLKKEEAEPDGQ